MFGTMPPMQKQNMRHPTGVHGAAVVVLAALAGGVAVGGCLADPSGDVGFNLPDPQARMRAARVAADSEDRNAIPNLVGMLHSDDAAERMTAIGALERLTGETMGYRHFDPRPVRAEAIDRWTAWLESRDNTLGDRPTRDAAAVGENTPPEVVDVPAGNDDSGSEPAPATGR